jgi:hypothetical protein
MTKVAVQKKHADDLAYTITGKITILRLQWLVVPHPTVNFLDLRIR